MIKKFKSTEQLWYTQTQHE